MQLQLRNKKSKKNVGKSTELRLPEMRTRTGEDESRLGVNLEPGPHLTEQAAQAIVGAHGPDPHTRARDPGHTHTSQNKERKLKGRKATD